MDRFVNAMGRCGRLIAALVLLGSAASPAVGANFGLQANPNLDLKGTGTVNAIARLSDGRLIVGGSFREVDGTAIHNLARLNADGSLDASWHPEPDQAIFAIAVDGNDNVFVSGPFSVIGGQPIIEFARIDAATGLVDPGFTPVVDGGINAMAYDGNGHVYVGGQFQMLGGQAHSGLARIDTVTKAVDAGWVVDVDAVDSLAADASYVYFGAEEYPQNTDPVTYALSRASAAGVLDLNFKPSVDGPVYGLAIAASKLYVCGQFTTIGGSNLPQLARIDISLPIPTTDVGWAPAPDGTYINAMTVDSSGRVSVNGDFSNIGGQSMPNGIAQLSSTAQANPLWNYALLGAPNVMLAQADGSVILGGALNTFSGPLHAGLLRVSTAGAFDSSFSGLVLGDGIGSVVRNLSDGTTLVGGNFLVVDSTPRRSLIHLLADGSLDTAWNLNVNGLVRVISEYDGAFPIYIAGLFTEVNGLPHGSIARIALDGSVDTSWNAGFSSGPGVPGDVYAVQRNPTDQLFVGGYFQSANSTLRSNLARFTASTGALDLGWNPSANNAVFDLALDGAGGVYFGGTFSQVGAFARSRLAKVNASSGMVDASWAPQPNSTVRHVLLDSVDNKLYITGSFSNVGGTPNIRRMARVSTAGTGALDVAWLPSANGPVNNLVLDPSGYLYFAGSFGVVKGNPIFALARTNVRSVANGAPDLSWDAPISTVAPSSGDEVPGTVYGIDVLPGGGVFVTGQFNRAQETFRGSLAAIGGVTDDIFHSSFE